MMSYDTVQYEKRSTTATCTEVICGINVRFIFAPEKNLEVSVIVSDILKGAYLRRQST